MFISSKFSVRSSRCLDDGAFDQLQCMGNQCVCVQRYFGILDDEFTRYDLDAGLNKIPCCNLFDVTNGNQSPTSFFFCS